MDEVETGSLRGTDVITSVKVEAIYRELLHPPIITLLFPVQSLEDGELLLDKGQNTEYSPLLEIKTQIISFASKWNSHLLTGHVVLARQYPSQNLHNAILRHDSKVNAGCLSPRLVQIKTSYKLV